jgi:2-oxoglutarate dehydrogenase E2 component (dihydrolipoamide succinyltransferase)
MAIVEVKVPQLSESVAEATLLQWKKKPGEAVALDEILIEIETDKVVLEVPAPAGRRAGRDRQVADGGTVVSDQVIARSTPKARPARAARRPPPQPRRRRLPHRGCTRRRHRRQGDVAMPAAAKLMADNNLAAGDVAAPARTAA